MTALLEAKDVSLPGRLQPSSLALRGGELTCLIGPNGSGKTSLLHALARIGGATGSVSVDGMDPAGLVPAERKRALSYLPASRDISWPLTGRDLVALGCATPDDRLQIEPLLAELELAELAGRRADRMSTGERSRFLIARALVARPRVLLLDEPAANLDPLWQLRLMDYLRRAAAARGQAMLVAVHDLELARHFADRLIIMSEGRIAADGEPGPLLAGRHMPTIFGIEQMEGRWMPVARRLEDRRSWP